MKQKTYLKKWPIGSEYLELSLIAVSRIVPAIYESSLNASSLYCVICRFVVGLKSSFEKRSFTSEAYLEPNQISVMKPF